MSRQLLRVSRDPLLARAAGFLRAILRVYYKHKSVGKTPFSLLQIPIGSLTRRSIPVRMVLSARYKGKLTEFAGSFTDEKQELQFLTAQHSATMVTEMSTTLEGVAGQVDKIVAFLDDVKSEKEKHVQDMI